MAGKFSLRCQGVGIQFDGHWLFRNLDWEIPKGSTYALIGPSGCGKTVLLKLLAGLLNPTEGSIENSDPNRGMLFQRNALFDSWTVLENLTFTLKENIQTRGDYEPKIAKKNAESLLEQVGLGGTGHLFPHELSGGMQKRLGIARALIARPSVLFYDEPTAGLDPVTSRLIADVILEFKKKQAATIVVVSNEMPRAFQLADRIFYLHEGHLQDAGTPDEIQHTHNREIRDFIYGHTI